MGEEQAEDVDFGLNPESVRAWTFANFKLPVRRKGVGGGDTTSERPEDDDEILILLDLVNGCRERDSVLPLMLDLPQFNDSVLPLDDFDRANDSVLVVLDNRVDGS